MQGVITVGDRDPLYIYTHVYYTFNSAAVDQLYNNINVQNSSLYTC